MKLLFSLCVSGGSGLDLNSVVISIMGFNLLSETIEEVEQPLTTAECSVNLHLRVFADWGRSPIDKEKSASAIPNPASPDSTLL